MIYVARSAIVVGDVAIGKDSSIWHGAVLRGDMEGIEIGGSTNLQDRAVVHVDVGNPAVIGDRVTVGHGAVVHGCRVGSDSIIGMGAIVSSRARIGPGCIVGAGAVVPEGAEVAAGSIAMGVPAKVVRATEEQHRLRIELSWRTYVALARRSLPAGRERRGDPRRRVRLEDLARAGDVP